MMKIILINIILLSFITNVVSQSVTDSIIDDLLYEQMVDFDFYKTDAKLQLLYVGAGYDNKVLYAGRETGIDNLSGYMGYLFYFHESGWGLGIIGSGYDMISPNYYTTIVSGGYSGRAKNNKAFRYRFSYNRYIYSDKENAGSTNNSVTSGITLGNSWIGSRLDLSVPFGREDISASVSWDAYFDFTILKKKQLRLDIKPQISLYYGSETVYQTITGRLPGDVFEYESDKFGMLNAAFELPLNITVGNFDIECGYEYNIARSLGDEDLKNTSNFSISVGYIIGL